MTASGPSWAAEVSGKKPSAETSTRFLILDEPFACPSTSSCVGCCDFAKVLPGPLLKTGPPAAFELLRFIRVIGILCEYVFVVATYEDRL